MSKPNILLFMSDEHPVFLTGCYGHRSVKTPTLDALAAGGAVFDAAYCPSPICGPSRAAMMAGRHSSTIEVWDNASPFRSDWPTFAHSFRGAGYRTILCGKMHFVGPDQQHGFEERWTQDIYPADFQWTRSNRGEVAVNGGQNIDRVYECGAKWTNDMDYDEEVVFRAETGLRRMARGHDDRPWMMVVSLTGPHYPFCAPPDYFNMYTDDDVDLPVIPENYLELEGEWVKWLRRHGKFDRLVEDDVCRMARRAILGRITMVDDYLKRVLKLADNLGENTYTIYASDHGEMLGEHGLWFKNAAYEYSSRVPFLVKGPGIAPRRIAETVSLLDLGCTLCGLSGVDPAAPVTDGRDLTDLLLGKREETDGIAIMENYGEGVLRGWRMIRIGQHKLVYVPGCEPELFDLSKDPHEWNNVADDPAYADVRAELERRVLENWEPERNDKLRLESEDRRIAINTALDGTTPLDWQVPSPPVPHPLRASPDAPINNVDV